MKKTTAAIALGLAVCIGVGAWYGLRSKPVPARFDAPTLVTVVTPQRGDVPVLLQANGVVTPLSNVDLHPQTTSTITKVHIREGQYVKAGQLMFTLDQRSASAAIDKAQAQIERDQAALADLERQTARSVALLAQHFVSQGAVDTLTSQVQGARGLLNADLAALRAAQVDASYSLIRAPLSGRVGAIAVYPGTLVQLATSLTTITRLDPVTVTFTLPESALAGVMAAQKTGPVSVSAALADGSVKVDGALSFIDNTVDSSTGAIRVKAQFDNRQSALWPGMYVDARLTVTTLKGALVIPQSAVISNTLGVFVYLMQADQSVTVQPVTRLYAFGANVAVSGLTGTEQVIVEGKQNLRPGSKVRLAPVKAAGSAP